LDKKLVEKDAKLGDGNSLEEGATPLNMEGFKDLMEEPSPLHQDASQLLRMLGIQSRLYMFGGESFFKDRVQYRNWFLSLCCPHSHKAVCCLAFTGAMDRVPEWSSRLEANLNFRAVGHI
jgi:hypothetical protein